MKLGMAYRGMKIYASGVDGERRTLDLIFSSELPVRQPFGKEILSHNHGAADLFRMKGGAPLLWNQNYDNLVGVVEEARVDNDRRGHALVRFSNSKDGNLIFRDVKEGIIRWGVVGYRILSMAQTGGDKKNPEFTVNRWHPYFVSLVSIAPDSVFGFSS